MLKLIEYEMHFFKGFYLKVMFDHEKEENTIFFVCIRRIRRCISELWKDKIEFLVFTFYSHPWEDKVTPFNMP